MSNTYKKLNYVSEGPWGNDFHGTLYYHYNGTGNSISIYDEHKRLILSYTKWSHGDKKDLGDAISFLLNWDEDKDYDVLEEMTPEEIEWLKSR